MADWNAEQYAKFLKDRTQPSIDLANRLGMEIENPSAIFDLGCGPGNSTHTLALKFPNAHSIGGDVSQNMLKKARTSYPEIEFIHFDGEKDFPSLSQSFDIVFSNACIQWIPNHKKLLAHMMGSLNKGGVLAVQIPLQEKQAMHTIFAETASEDKWKHRFPRPLSSQNILSEEEYFDILSELSGDFCIWETTYCHRMPSHQSIIEWFKGSGLRPYLEALPPEEALEFEKDVYAKTVKAYPIRNNGEILFYFPRLFFTAVK